MKQITFFGDSLAVLRAFPEEVRSEAGFQLRAVQKGRDPADWKPMTTVGPGVREIRVREASGAFRVIYLATDAGAVLVLHAFQKKDQRTPQRDIELASNRLKVWNLKAWRKNMEDLAMEIPTVETQTFDDVFDAISDTPEQAANLKARAELLAALVERVRSWAVPQEIAAARLHITRPRLSDLLRGKLAKFSLDALVNLTVAAGLTIDIRIGDAA